MTDEISYREEFKLWWPKYDHKPEACHKRVVTRSADLLHTIHACKQRKVVVQAGGHAGVWALKLAEYFERVYTFEPDPVLAVCMGKNVLAANRMPQVVTVAAALGAENRKAMMQPHCSAGSWKVDDEKGTVPVQMFKVDTLMLEHLDALVLDVEGHEMEVLKGAAETIKKHRPVIHLELLPNNAIRYHRAMEMLGYRVHKAVHSDVIFVPE